QREGRLLLLERATDADAGFVQALRPLRRHERALAGHRAVADVVEGLPANRADARLRDDVDEERAGVVILGGEAVARDVNRLDLRLRRKRRAFEAVDPNHRARTGDVA